MMKCNVALTTGCFIGVSHHLSATFSASTVVVRIHRIPFALHTVSTIKLVPRSTY